jgi:hypothetical protein
MIGPRLPARSPKLLMQLSHLVACNGDECMLQRRIGVSCLSLPLEDEPGQSLQPWLSRAVLFSLGARPATPHRHSQAVCSHEATGGESSLTPSSAPGASSRFRAASGLLSGAESPAGKEEEKGKGTVLIHCTAGVSRSASVVVALLLVASVLDWAAAQTQAPTYLQADTGHDRSSAAEPETGTTHSHACFRALKFTGVVSGGKESSASPVQCCLAFVRRSRPFVRPNWGFMQQLELFADGLGRAVTVGHGVHVLQAVLDWLAAQSAVTDERGARM